MKKLFEKIALACALLLCLFLVVMGVAVWFGEGFWISKYIVSFLCIIAAIAFGALGIDLWRDV